MFVGLVHGPPDYSPYALPANADEGKQTGSLMWLNPEVKDLRVGAAALKEVVADLTLENRLLKKA